MSTENDPARLLSYLLEKLGCGVGNRVRDPFVGLLVTTTACLGCTTKTRTSEDFEIIVLDPKDGATSCQELLSAKMKKKTKKRNCPNCLRESRETVQRKATKVPVRLVLNLSR